MTIHAQTHFRRSTFRCSRLYSVNKMTLRKQPVLLPFHAQRALIVHIVRILLLAASGQREYHRHRRHRRHRHQTVQ